MPAASILCESDLHADWFAQPLLDAGFHVQRCTLEQVPQRLAGGQFSVLILGRLYVLHKTRQQEEAIVGQVRAAMDQFLRQGGGVFIALSSGGTISLNPILEPYGISLQPAAIDLPEDCRITKDNGTWRVRYGCTPDVRGLNGQTLGDVWFPAEIGSCLTTRPLRCQADAGWKSALTAPRGSSLSRLVEGQGNGALVDDEPGADDDGDLSIISVRDGVHGSGRLAVCGVAAGFHFGAPHTFKLARQFLHDGFDDRPSALGALLIDVLQWLSRPAAQRGLGGAASDDDLLLPHVPRFPDDPPQRWPAQEFPPIDRPWRGLIGARTALSVGSGTVEQYVAAARRHGLDFLVFLEDFRALTPEKLDQLKAECRRLSDEQFLAVPGYTLDDVAGNHSFQYGYEIVWPRPDLLSADGKILANRGPAAGTSRNTYVDHLHGSLAFGEFQMRCRRGFFMHADSRIQLTDHRYVDSLALVTWHRGRVIDDIRPQHRRLADNGMRMNPTIITLLDAPADIDLALQQGWHNQVLEPYGHVQDRVQRRFMAPELEWWGFINEDVVGSPRYRFDSWQYGLPFQCASSGPIVEAWTVSISDRDLDWRAPDCEIPPTADWYRIDVATFRLRIAVSSDVGLDEVRLFDGQRLIRCWRLNGQARFEQELDLTHHQQTHLLLEASDVRGGVAISSEYLSYRRDWCEFYCADRNNPLQIGYEKDEQGLAYGWSGTLYLTYNNGHWGGNNLIHGRWWYYGDKMYPVPMDPRHDPIQPTDGGVGFSAGGLHLMPDLSQLDPPEHVLMIQPRQEMISTDVAICGFDVEHGANRDWPGFFGAEQTSWSLFPTEPTRYLQLRRRAIVFRPKPNALTTTIYEHQIRFKRDVHAPQGLVVGWFDDHPRHVLQRGDELCELDGRDEVTWNHGEVVIAWTQGARPAMFLNDGPALTLFRQTARNNRLALRLTAGQLPPVGQTQRLRFIGIGGTVHHTSASIWSEVASAMGLRGEPAYRLLLTQGKVQNQRLLLDVISDGGGVTFDLPRVELPMALPLRVHGLNENWPVVLYDRAAGRWRPLGLLESVAYATLDTAADASLYLGHPVLCDHDQVVLSLALVAPQRFRLEAHNPTPQAMDVTIRAAAGFDLLGDVQLSWSIQPGQSRQITLESATPRHGAKVFASSAPR